MNSQKNATIRILMVEDNEDDFILTEALLHEIPSFIFQLEWVVQFDDALTLMQENRHEVYLVDYLLGKQTGLDLLRAATSLGCRGPIIFFTGRGDYALDVEAMEAGAVDYLIKDQIDGPLLERSIRYAIQQKRIEADLAEMQLRLAESQEKERLYIAQELHDGPLQELMGVHFHLTALANLIDGTAVDEVNQIQAELQAATQQLRALCIELRPPVLAPFGLTKAIRSHVKKYRAKYPALDVELELDDDELQLPEGIRLALYRICQHALTNVASHAQATTIKITFRLDNEQIMMQVRDDGRGFHMPLRLIDLAREGHLGLVDSAERAEAIGGRLEINSSLDCGTTLTVRAPRP